MTPFQYNVVHAPTMIGLGGGGGLEDDDDETELWGELAHVVFRGYPLFLYITTIL